LENKLPRLFVPTNPLIAVLGLLYAIYTQRKKIQRKVTIQNKFFILLESGK